MTGESPWILEIRRRLEREWAIPDAVREVAEGTPDARPAAVLVPLFVRERELWTLLTKRSEAVEHHRDGSVTNRPVIPLGVTIDERIAPGAVFAMALHQWEVYMRNPERLEQPPDFVRYDDGLVYPKPKKK